MFDVRKNYHWGPLGLSSASRIEDGFGTGLYLTED